jgi:putative Holliday junction resolvase
MRLLAIDPGEKYIGVAVSDPTGIVARPLTTLRHEARAQDAARIVALAAEQEAEGILIGLALDSEGQIGPQARRGDRLAEAVRALTSLPIVLYDESNSSRDAQSLMLEAGTKRRARKDAARIHAVAAAAILQSYLDAHPRETTPGQ